MRLRCAILDDYQNVSQQLADWQQLADRIDVKVFTERLETQDAVATALQGFEIVCLMRERTPFPRALFERLPDLKLLITTGAQNAAVDVAAAKDHGVTFCGTKSTGQPTATLAFALMLELTRRVGFENARMHAGAPWQITLGEDIEGRTLGLLGLGRLGARTAEIGKAFKMKCIAWSQNLTPERCAEVGVTYVSREELFSTADVVSIHLALGTRNRGLVTAADLGRMKKTAYIINTSRGPIIEEAALIDTLRERRIAGAGLDVFWEEPLPLNHPLRGMDNVVLSPHLGYVTREGYTAFFTTMVEDIAGWLDGKPVRVILPK